MKVQILRIRVATAEVAALNHTNTSNPRPQFVTL
jgi:hypothetical protein